MKNLIWKIDIQKLNGGYWECQYCGAIYNQPKNWEPIAGYCMKCKGEWIFCKNSSLTNSKTYDIIQSSKAKAE